MIKELVTLHRQGSVAILSLNRAERHNALVPELLSSFLDVLGSDECQEAGAVVLRAEGRSFSTGGDLLGFQQNRAMIRDYAFEVVGLLNQVILAIYTNQAPVVCAVHGQVTGGSIGFLLASDRVVMNHSATITPWYAPIGFSPDGGWMAMLPHIIGRQQTLEWLANNACNSADTCYHLGVAHEVVKTGCGASALVWANHVAAKQVGGINRRHRLLNIDSTELARRLEAECKAFIEQVETSEAMNGIDRFLG